VLLPLLTPVPPYVGEITPDNALVPSNGYPKIFLGVCNALAVLAVPDNVPIKFDEVIFVKPV
jgi:hypothetical protein